MIKSEIFALLLEPKVSFFVYIYTIETLLLRYEANEHFATYIAWDVYTDQLATSTKAVG